MHLMSVKAEMYFPEIKSNYMDKDLMIPAFLVAGLSCSQISGFFGKFCKVGRRSPGLLQASWDM